MSSTERPRKKEPYNAVVGALTDERRRRVLELLLDRDRTLTVTDLATHLAVTERETTVDAIADEAVRSLRIDLVHAQLPKLEEAGLIDWNRESETVAITTHPALDDPRLRRLLESDADGLDAVLEALSHERRRTIVCILADRDRSMCRADLVCEVIAHESDRESAPDPEAVRSVAGSLHHVHLPKLEAAELIEYDTTDETVSYEGHAALSDDLLALERFEPPVAYESEIERPVRTPAGREHGSRRALCDYGDE